MIASALGAATRPNEDSSACLISQRQSQIERCRRACSMLQVWAVAERRTHGAVEKTRESPAGPSAWLVRWRWEVLGARCAPCRGGPAHRCPATEAPFKAPSSLHQSARTQRRRKAGGKETTDDR